MNDCRCFGRLALRLGLIDDAQLRAALADAAPVAEALVRRGDLSVALAARVEEALSVTGCRHGLREAA